MTNPIEEVRSDYVGDGYDPEPLLDYVEVGEWLGVPPKSVYGLPIPRVRISQNRYRWRPADVREFIKSRVEHP